MIDNRQTHSRTAPTLSSRLRLGALLVILAEAGQVAYGIMFLIRNFSGFTELGLTPQQVGGSPQQIWAFSPELYRYISHLHVAISGYMLGIGILSIALAWYGIRRGERWALWTILLGTAITAAVAVPLHYPYGLPQLGIWECST